MKKFFRILWCVYGAAVLLLVAAFAGIRQGWIGYMPPFEELSDPIDRYATQVFSADGKLLGTWSQSENRVFVPRDSISDHVLHALVATEDVRFADHSGIDSRALLRAVVKRGLLGRKSAGGGSTITQQLAKQLYSATAGSTLQRLFQKPIEWVIAVELEKHYTKEEILTLYLNYFDFLHNAVGIKTAARVYFGKSPKALTVAESAMLVGMCKNPSFYNPVRSEERVRERRNVVLEQMVKARYLDAHEAAALKATPLGLNFRRLDHKDGQATYLREYLRRVLMAPKPERRNYASWQDQEFYQDSLSWENNPLYGWCKKNTKRDGTYYNIYTDGLKVFTTIDSRMQHYAEEAVLAHVGRYLQREFEKQRRTSRTFPYSQNLTARQVADILARSERQSDRWRALKADGATEEEIERSFNTPVEMSVFTYQGERDTVMTPMDSIRHYKSFLRSALVSVEPQSGYVKAYVGGIDFSHFQYDMATVGRRQIGSTMKPFVYAMAMEDGLTPEYAVLNEQVDYGGWAPRNGSRARYGEMVPLSWGLAQSNNWVTANLMAQVDPSGRRLAGFLHTLGVANRNIYPSMALCLGPCDISVSELASAYTIFVNKGIRCAPVLVTRIEDSQGNVLAEFAPRMNEAISEQASYDMLRMLQGVVNGGTGGRLRYRYGIEGDVAGKTGTTNNNSDGWFVGLLPRLVTACWVGGDDRDIHFNSTSMGQGATMALPVCGLYLSKIYADGSLGYSRDEKFVCPVAERPGPDWSVEEPTEAEPRTAVSSESARSPSRPKASQSGEHLFE